MAYSREMHERARDEIRNRKNNAEYTATQHKNELSLKYPEFQFIETELAKTGMETVSAFALPKEEAEKRLDIIREKNRQLRIERTNLLKALNLPENYLDVNYTCEKCNDTGLVEDFDQETRVSYGTKYCSCYNAIYTQTFFTHSKNNINNIIFGVKCCLLSVADIRSAIYNTTNTCNMDISTYHKCNYSIYIQEKT